MIAWDTALDEEGSIALEWEQVAVRDLEALAASSVADHVRALEFAWCTVDADAFDFLATSDAFRELRGLFISHQPIGDMVAEALSRSRALAGLRELGLQRVELSSTGASCETARWARGSSDLR